MSSLYRRGSVFVFALAAALGGCGGGGDPAPAAPPAPTVAGLYFGTTTTGGTFDALLLPNGRFYGMLGAGGGLTKVFFGSGAVPTGAGFNTTAGGNLTLSSGAPMTAGSVTLTGTPKTSISGTLVGTGTGLPATFTSNYSAAFEGTPSLAAVAGSYIGDSAGLGRTIVLRMAVAADGAITGTTSEPCTHTGTLAPNTNANVFDLVITFGAGCPARGSLSGHAIWSPAAGAVPAVLTLFASAPNANSAFAEGWFFTGGKLP